MKKSRIRILRQIGRGLKEAEFNRLKRDALKIARTELPVRTLRKEWNVPAEYLDKVKEEILSDFARVLDQNNFVKWQFEDDLYWRGRVRITGELRVVKPEDQ